MLAALAPTLAEAMNIARTKEFIPVDGTLLPTDRIAADTAKHSGNPKRHGMNIQVLTQPVRPPAWGLARVVRHVGLKC